MKKILFLTGTRADFGKLKPLMRAVQESHSLELRVFATGMHMLSRYGLTVNEVAKCGLAPLHTYINQRHGDPMDVILSKTIAGLSDYVREDQPDLIVVHGDRVEALAGAIVGSLNNILVAHVEGGEVSGTIDEVIRHSVSKMSHLHFVSNREARGRLLQLGEHEDSIYVIGSPDLDVMLSPGLPSIDDVRRKYDIPFGEYCVFLFHPVTTELDSLAQHIRRVVAALVESELNYVVIYPNNDHGSDTILSELARLHSLSRFRVFPSVRFEHFLTLLKFAFCMVGNSSAGVREAPFYGVPSINIGSRQQGRATANTIINVAPSTSELLAALASIRHAPRTISKEFGAGNSAEAFVEALGAPKLWSVSTQKAFVTRA